MRGLIFVAMAACAASPEEAIRRSLEAEKFFDESRYEAASQAYAQAVPLLTEAMGEAHARTLIAINNHAAALLQLNLAPAAESILRDALDRRKRAGLAIDETAAATYTNLGEAFALEEKFTAAARMHERALEIRRSILNAGHPNLAESLHSLGEALRRAGELTRAEKHLRAAAEIWKSNPGTPLMPGYAKTLNSLGVLYTTQGNYTRSERGFRDALQAAESAYGSSHEIVATLEYNYAALFRAMGDWKQAERHCRQALNVFELLPGYNDHKVAIMLEMHAQILSQLPGRSVEAKGQLARSRAILSLR